MIGILVRENPALRHLGKWVAISLVTSALMLNVLTWQLSAGGDDAAGVAMTTLFTFLSWVPLTVYLAFGRVRTRCSALGMVLPVSSRRLWGAHMLSVAIGAFALLAAAILAVVGGTELLSRLTDKDLFSAADMAAPAIHLASLLVLAIVVLDLRAPTMRTVPTDRRGGALTAIALLAVLPVALFMMRLPAIFAAVPLLAAVAIGMRRYRALPEAFSLTPASAAPAPVPVVADSAGWSEWSPTPRSSLSNAILVNSTVSRSIFRKKAGPFIAVPFVLFFGAFLSGLDEMWVDENIRSLTIVMAAYLLMAFIIEPLFQIHRVDALPVSRRRVFAFLVMAPLVTLAIGYGVGRIIIASATPRGEVASSVDFRDTGDGDYRTIVPIEFCEISVGGDVPENPSPWGESNRAWSTPLHRGSPVRLYSPFSVGENASVDFVALQISRAIETVYGEPITPEEIERRYLREGADGGAVLASETLSIEEDFPQLAQRRVGPVFPVVFMLVAVLWLVTLRVYLPVFRAGRSRRMQKTVGFTLMGLLFSLYVLQLVADVSGVMHAWVLMGFVEILVRHAGDAFAGSSLLVWIGCLGVMMITYLWVERRFRRIESTPVHDDSCSIL